MPSPQMDCLGLSYQGKFYVLSDQVGLPEQKTSDVFNPLERTWYTVDDVWPFSRAMHFAVQVMTDDRSCLFAYAPIHTTPPSLPTYLYRCARTCVCIYIIL